MRRTITRRIDAEFHRTPRHGGARRWLIALLAPAVLVAFLGIARGQELGHHGGPRVFPPHAHPYGSSYGEWSTRWVRWVFSLPESAHPLTDSADCNAGQSGHVWYLGGMFGGFVSPDPSVVIGEADRDCTIPSGTALFFPVVNATCSTLFDPSQDEGALRECALGIMAHVTAMEARIDGARVWNLESYDVLSPLFTYGPVPEDAILDQPAGEIGEAITDGVYLMVKPLSVGDHRIRFSGTFEYTQEQDGFDFLFLLDITYHITVVAEGCGAGS